MRAGERRPQSRGEKLIAVSRLVLSIAALVAGWVDPIEAYSAAAEMLLLIYVAYAGWLVVWNFATSSFDARLPALTHAADLTFFTALYFMTGGAMSPYFIYFIFSLLCAILRFGRGGMIATAGVVALVFLLSIAMGGEGGWANIDRFIIRAVYLIVVATLLIYVADSQQRVNRELSRIATWPRSSWMNLSAVVHQLLEHASGVLGSARILLAFEEGADHHAFIGKPGEGGFVVEELSPEVGIQLLGSAADVSVVASNPSDGTTAFARNRPQIENAADAELPPDLISELGIESMVAVSFRGDFVRGRVLFLDVHRTMHQDLTMGVIIADTIGSRLDHYHTVQQLKKGAVAEERVRVARDLHDSILQSLTGAALQLQTIPRIMVRDPAEATERLTEIQQVISTDQRELRWMIDTLHAAGAPGSVGVPYDIETRLRSLQQRFRHHWNMDVEISVEPTLRLAPSAVHLEVYSIVSEAVANAAKHASAGKVTVEVRYQGSAVDIMVADDGKGFPFQGHFTLTQLLAAARGPVTLKERVASLHGEMSIDSTPTGSRIEIRVPVTA
jgi:signal transduction histidine kinase